MAELAEGSVFAGYEVGSVLGRGAMGVVYQARDPKLERDVALKVVAEHLAQDASFRERFVQEARAVARVEHPGVVAIYQTGEERGVPFLAMRLVRGRELSKVLAEHGRLTPDEALRLLRPVAEGLDAAHAAGIVHRDVKPANIIVPADGSPPVLVDFGIGRVMQETRATQTGSWVGTVDYVAPEQIRGGAVDGRADQYALGCVMHELVMGTPPFRRDDTIQTLFAQASDPPPVIATGDAEADARLNAAVGRALAKRPEERFATCRDLLGSAAGSDAPAAAETARAGTLVIGVPPSGAAVPKAPRDHVLPELPARRSRAKRIAVLAAVALAVVVGGAVALIALGGSAGSSDGTAATTASTMAASITPTTTAAAVEDPRLEKLRTALDRYDLAVSDYYDETIIRYKSMKSEWKSCSDNGDIACTWEVSASFSRWSVGQFVGLGNILKSARLLANGLSECSSAFDDVIAHWRAGVIKYQRLIEATVARDTSRQEAALNIVDAWNDKSDPTIICFP